MPIRQLLTRFSTSDWLIAMLKSVLSMAVECEWEVVSRRTVSNRVESITREVVLVITFGYLSYSVVTHLLSLPGLARKSMKDNF